MFDVARREFFGAGLALGASISLPSVARAAWSEIVETRNGRLRGRRVGDVLEFRGIRYADPQTPDNRFRRAIPLKPWTGVRDALRDGNQAMQFPAEAKMWAGEFRDFAPMSEDCLFLNVFAPGQDLTRKRPVMFWCHGGGFATGSSTVPVYNGNNLAAFGDVVVVTVNHRLSSFGYVNLRDVAGEEFMDAGNAGMLDIIDALRWVRDNIAQFGGDPTNVTLFGESGGGVKVTVLLGMPEAAGLFHKAIVQSGSFLRQLTREESVRTAKKLLTRLELDPSQASLIRSIPAYELLTAAMPFRGEFTPVVDEVHLPRHSFDPDASPLAKPVPMIVGTNETETSLWATDEIFALDDASMRALLVKASGDKILTVIDSYRRNHPDDTPTDTYLKLTTDIRWRSGAIAQAERKVRQGGAPVFMYEFAWQSPVDGGKWKSPHAIDLPFMFRNQRMRNMRWLVGAGPRQDALADQLTSAWVAFAKTGNPTNPRTGTWKAYDLSSRSTMVFGESTTLVEDPDGADRKLFMAFR
jgi:para-nitrobenzyl esterase